MSNESIAVVKKLNESTRKDANVEVVQKAEDGNPDEASTKELKTENAKAEQATTEEAPTKEATTKETTTKEATTKEPTAKENATEEVVVKSLLVKDPQTREIKVQEDLESQDHDGLKSFISKKSRTHFNEVPDKDKLKEHKEDIISDEILFKQAKSEDIISLAEIKSKKSVICQGFIGEIDEDLEDSDDSMEFTSSYVFQKEIEFKTNFFDELGDIPDISEISSESSRESLSRISLKSKVTDLSITDFGTFVDPLTGEVESEGELAKPEPEPEPEVVEKEEEDEKWDVEDDDLLVLIEGDQEVVEKKRGSAEKQFETFMQMEEIQEEPTEPDIDYVAIEKEKMQRQLLVITIDFISKLIEKVVETCEYLDKNVIMRQNLDKIKLMEDIELKLLELDVEQKTRVFLNRKIVDYFKRKKAFRSILDDNPDTIRADIKRFRDATAKLDLMIGRNDDLRKVTEARLAALNIEMSAKEEEARKEITEFEDMVIKSFHRDTFHKLPQVVTNLLSRIENLRDEVSDVRFVLIQRQHTFASLMEKLEKLENLGAGLSMADFEHLQTETRALDKKIEERNSELNKLRTRCNAELHIMSHMKEKQITLLSAIAIQRNVLDELQWQKNFIRQRLFQFKLNRGKIRNEIHEMSFQGGILDKPALMFDYDDTVDRLKIVQHKVTQYKNKYTELHKKIQKLEKKYDYI